MNPYIKSLHPYPFEKLADLLSDIAPHPEKELIKLTIGEPQHAAPEFVKDCLAANLNGISKYPLTKGEPALSEAIAQWCRNRFSLQSLDPKTQVIPVTGTREALFAITQTLIDSKGNDLIISPNPFYQIYEGAGILAGADLHFLSCDANSNYQINYKEVPDAIWERCKLLFVCSPNNPTGSLTSLEDYAFLIEKAKMFHFTLVADECYSEIYFDESQKPLGLLEACQKLGHLDYHNCLVFHSLSKRSNLPGLRSGFVAGDANILKAFLLYRTYQGCAMPPHHQTASILAWQDEEHVLQNRNLYRKKFKAVIDILAPVMPISHPEAAFYLWPKTAMDDETFCRELYQQESVLVLPGRYLARTVNGFNPGNDHVRMALVANEEDCIEAAQRIKRFILNNTKTQ
ncbi:succinyldiaminopimelate transaminase [Marinomonas sp. 15G1-11]|uniref:Succinyldiaminopimelate transaminase n=1 Tax=Marinomonas phaeophyticola TaxID=3004091 RepID=A0ABT4JUI3_9GAMM|nr:succinyldiaminopimelate transaminase [Marinomonas sp. 15G1-11]MCZ2721697.1 succinyldiaminopimelate transaminase [Marinomonas sp. 15G1-11]